MIDVVANKEIIEKQKKLGFSKVIVLDKRFV